MDSTPPNTTDQEALRHQLEAMGVESTTSITTLGADTPRIRDNLSHETLDLLNQAADSLNKAQNKGIKRLRTDSNSTDNRLEYPSESKAIYLKAKGLYRRKLTIAVNLHHIRDRLKQGKYPTQENLPLWCLILL